MKTLVALAALGFLGAVILEHFKYGALGTEERAGVPYWIWQVLPIVFADTLPNRPGSRAG